MPEDRQEEEPQIHVDEDWKEQVKEEKERLREQEQSAPSAKAGAQADEPSFPEPNIQYFMAGLYTQTLIALGEVEEPGSGEKRTRLKEAEYLIDTVAMLREKMEGNLEPAESAYVQSILTDLRMRYVNHGRKEKETGEKAPEGSAESED